MLHGSRARGDAHAGSDWDFAYRGDAGFDPDALLARLADHLRADRIDLVDLDRAGALLAFASRGTAWRSSSANEAHSSDSSSPPWTPGAISRPCSSRRTRGVHRVER
ncbi:MAG: nucleotidyltransferase domain-containing protein [Vicinamibacterales bacterium]